MNLVWLAAGGALGSLARHAVYMLCQRLGAGAAESGSNPGAVWGTLAVNTLGSLLFGVVAAWLGAQLEPRPGLRLFALAGFLGAFTTFSTFAYQALELGGGGAGELGDGRSLLRLALHIVLNNAFAIGAAWCGWRLVRAALA